MFGITLKPKAAMHWSQSQPKSVHLSRFWRVIDPATGSVVIRVQSRWTTDEQKRWLPSSELKVRPPQDDGTAAANYSAPIFRDRPQAQGLPQPDIW